MRLARGKVDRGDGVVLPDEEGVAEGVEEAWGGGTRRVGRRQSEAESKSFQSQQGLRVCSLMPETTAGACGNFWRGRNSIVRVWPLSEP